MEKSPLFKPSDAVKFCLVGSLALELITILPGTLRAQVVQSDRQPSAGSQAAVHPLDPALAFVRANLDHMQVGVRDYTALLTKRCCVDGVLSDYQYSFIKVRHRREESNRGTIPMSVYMNFLKPDTVKGREVIWVEGRNDGNIAAHEGGVKNVLTLNLEPRGPLAMRGQRYPITDIGMLKLAEKMIEKGDRDRRFDECEVNFYQNVMVDKRKCTVIEIVHPHARSHFDFHRAQLIFDDELKMPIRYVSWLWPTVQGGQPVLDEEYTYTSVKINVELTDSDFDPNNPAYKFW